MVFTAVKSCGPGPPSSMRDAATLPTRGGSQGPRGNITVCPCSWVQQCRGRGQWEKSRHEGLGLYRAHSAPHRSLSPLHTADVWVRHSLGSWPTWAESKSGATQPLGSESCLFGSRSPVFSSSPHISAQYTSSISDSHPALVLSSPSLEVFQKSGCFRIITV
ncbi:hypothetical protein mRhiFer1_009345 [Rhinolophus ferrumequinum]|uniref:Uncharacterized protein n=1 Tax=Rhinolophus ferrumequinum TaxID=59479 RepID=A0A7J7RYL7_RHIFE|nr:hypothetical protein mRhiFer1_009345 [Rhinolophus ferrumequinum]